MNSEYSCRVFPRDASDRKLLRPGRGLYGCIVESTKTIFLSPYVPPDNSQPLIGIVSETGATPQRSLLTHLSVDDDLIMASGFI